MKAAGALGLMLLAFLAWGCSERQLSGVDSPCSYREIAGEAKVLSVEPAPLGGFNCPNDALEVRFEFHSPAGLPPAASSSPPTSSSVFLLKMGSGMNPPRQWVEAEGLVPGSVHRCRRQEITVGACPAVRHVFPDLDFAAAEKLCFPP